MGASTLFVNVDSGLLLLDTTSSDPKILSPKSSKKILLLLTNS